MKQLGLSAVLLACLSSATPVASLTHTPNSYDTSMNTTVTARADNAGADRVPLRIMPFGASIMSGFGSKTDDGYVSYSLQRSLTL